MLKLLFKPKNISSFKFIKNFAKENGIKKIGHSGTLDPLATGLLLVASDEDTKILNFITNKNKGYLAKAQLGYSSDTYDLEGNIIKNDAFKISKRQLLNNLQKFVGTYLQNPPNYSAKKIAGKRAYQLARENKEFKLKPQSVSIFLLELIDFDFENQRFTFQCLVSNGTYIRSLIHDIGQKLKTGAYMLDLERNLIHNLDFSYLNKELDPLLLIDKKQIKLSFLDLKKLYEGKDVFFKSKLCGEFALVYKKNFIGLVFLEYSKITKRHLIGTKIVKILSKGEDGNEI